MLEPVASPACQVTTNLSKSELAGEDICAPSKTSLPASTSPDNSLGQVLPQLGYNPWLHSDILIGSGALTDRLATL